MSSWHMHYRYESHLLWDDPRLNFLSCEPIERLVNMTFILAFVAFGAMLTIALLVVARKQGRQIAGIADFESRWQKVDMDAFANLIDPSEQRYLQRNLPAAEFRKLQRERVTIM